MIFELSLERVLLSREQCVYMTLFFLRCERQLWCKQALDGKRRLLGWRFSFEYIGFEMLT